MKITALIENEATGNLVGEHGLAIHIEYNGKQYLLDTGASDQFLNNTNELGIDINNIDAAALSHSHYDHSGGYVGFFLKTVKQKYTSKVQQGKCVMPRWVYLRNISVFQKIF